MSGIRGKNTKPELVVRHGLHLLGFRFRLHDPRLPGKPDLVLPKYKAVIQVNGCFWHGHDCHLFKFPKTRVGFWKRKITRNRANDTRNVNALRTAKWRVLVIWECAIKGSKRLTHQRLIELSSVWLRSEKRVGCIVGNGRGLPNRCTDSINQGILKRQGGCQNTIN